MAVSPQGRVPSMREVIDERGQFTGQRCQCCNQAKLFRVPVGDDRDPNFMAFVACLRCDVEKKERI